MARDILIVDDEADIRQLIAGILEDEGYEARVAGNSTEVLRALAQRRPSLVVLDIWLQGSEWDGLQLLDHLNAEHPGVPVIIISGHGNIETAVAAIKRGAYDYIEKPFKADRLLLFVQRAIQAARLERENRDLKQRAIHETEFVGNCVAIAAARAAIDKVAATGSRVLIAGPAGSGKEVAARRLHALSSRGEGPFVVLNAAMLAPERVEIELFGEEGRGSDGNGRRVGLFEQAHGGTLFLDEVADMPLETQGKILRVLVDQNFQRVGGGDKVQVDVRVISSSTRDLRREIVENRFREDLYHRLNVVPIQIPSLKERHEDIPMLVAYFMRRSAEMLGLSPREVSPDALSALQSYEWPGNVRQLRNIIERLLIMTPGNGSDVIRVDMLPPEINSPTPASLMPDNSAEVMSMPLREAREAFERQYLMAQVGRFGGNISRTAEFVGMERSALHRKLKTLGVHQRGVGEAALSEAAGSVEA
jgi:two-component system nitrogen regulation response regulator NtrX